ncbi:MAG: Fe-S-containing hydro-lyase [Clostridia bacterium]|nr:Fe-S-containing hydro-lyase [Clostridia bacterium]
MEKVINLPLTDAVIEELHAGDRILLCGEMLVMRDAAHKRLYDAIKQGDSLPFSVENETVYYMGPSPARQGKVIGSAGPTTSARMDKYTPSLLSLGLKGMVGKGRRSPEVIAAMEENCAVYFAAIGGCGALLSKCITSSEIICYGDLGTEAVRRITVKDFPCIVAIDCKGNNLYEQKS